MLTWNVYVYNFNHKKIEVHNIFNHSLFVDDCRKARRKYKDNKELFSEAVRTSLMYYYWSKCEWEIQLASWPYHEERDEMKKIDAFAQIEINWDRFIDYVWNNRKELAKNA